MKKIAKHNLSVEEMRDDGGWEKHTRFHWSRILIGKQLDFWPSTGKYRYNGKTFTNSDMDVYEFISYARLQYREY